MVAVGFALIIRIGTAIAGLYDFGAEQGWWPK